MKALEWSPHILAAAEAMFDRLAINSARRWDDLDIDAADHYCIAAKLAVDAFHQSATRAVEVDYS
ncbi:hypothetical protein JRC04_05285 [Mycolicibacterium sp. S2-37]|uniref:hypothetical protein n=1 Tax=Mycolicibacterium sp. S2-37 TaxID=2810297 RepID=UPI001A94EC29|nr:hypothetical protein [Mycolicibacterium sp. S2-37]MBO0676868.1 hypothetical protein [Mycolicibacterium sp. S2-37]